MFLINLKNNTYLYFIFLLLYLGDTLTCIFLKETFNYSWLSKAFITVLLLYNLYDTNIKLLYKLLFLYGIIFLGFTFNYLNDFLAKTSLFFEYTSGILFLNFIIYNANKKLLSNLLNILFLIYVITIIIAFCLNISYLHTYNSERFGYKPIFSSQNEFSYIIITIIVFYYKKYKLNMAIQNLSFLILALLASLLLGTKTTYLFLFVFINYIVTTFLKERKKLYIVLFTLLITCIALALYLVPIYFPVFLKIYSESGLLDVLSSNRLAYLFNRLSCQIANFKTFNYLFGGSNLNCITEMSIFDIFLFFGFIGGAYYIYLIKEFILNKLKLDTIGLVFVILISTLSLLGGYYFENFSAQVYTVSVLYLFYHKNES